MTKILGFQKNVLSLGVLLTAVTVNSITLVNAEEIDPLEYDTIMGENSGQFMDLDSDDFLLQQSEWYAIQSYVESALRLPTTQASMRANFAIPDDIAFTNFDDILEKYVLVHDTADNWNRDIYPDVVSLALKLANYAQTHSSLMEPIFDALDNMGNAEDDTTKKDNQALALVLLDSLKTYSEARQADAEAVELKLKNFSADIADQKIDLEVLEENNTEYLKNDGSDIKVELSDALADLATLNAEYERLVTISSTTVTYAWWAPVGTVAAIATASVYGPQAVSKADDIKRKKAEIDELREKLTYTENLYASYQLSYSNTVAMEEKLATALPYIEDIKLHWQGIVTDFDSVMAKIDSTETGLGNASLFAAEFAAKIQLTSVQEHWMEISNEATEFTQNAYIVVIEE